MMKAFEKSIVFITGAIHPSASIREFPISPFSLPFSYFNLKIPDWRR
jgi:hypothetical protein